MLTHSSLPTRPSTARSWTMDLQGAPRPQHADFPANTIYRLWTFLDVNGLYGDCRVADRSLQRIVTPALKGWRDFDVSRRVHGLLTKCRPFEHLTANHHSSASWRSLVLLGLTKGSRRPSLTTWHVCLGIRRPVCTTSTSTAKPRQSLNSNPYL